MEYKINYGETTLPIDIAEVEKKYSAKYIGDFCLKTRSGNWSEDPAAIFYQEKPPVEGYSNYFGILYERGRIFITSGASAFSQPIQAIISKEGEVVYSRFRHDYRSLSDGSGGIDGGRDYQKMTGDFNSLTQCTLTIQGPELVVTEFKEPFLNLV